MSKSLRNLDLRKAALSDQRKRLKIKLWQERCEDLRWLSISVPRPRCPWCSLPLPQPDVCVMHEWLVKRSALPISLQVKVMHEYNCVLAHYNCHHDHGQTREFKQRCAEAQYKRYTREKIVAWVESLGLKQTVEIPEEEDGVETAI